LDTGVLVAAWRGAEPYKSAARLILESSSLELIASTFLKLETLPKARNKGSVDEVQFLEFVYSLVSEWVPMDESLVERAIEVSTQHKVMNIDAIHVACALRVGVDQFVTSELPGKPFYAIAEINAVNILEAKIQ
jgi:predicted nucleic acid-binding protein